MARTPAQRGRIGNWLVESRLSRGWHTQEAARAEIQRLTGWRIPQSVYAEWESGRRLPSDANLGRLQEFYGPATGLEATQSPDALVAALTAQTARLSELVAALDEERAERVAFQRGLLSALQELARVAGRQGDPVPAPRAPTAL